MGVLRRDADRSRRCSRSRGAVAREHSAPHAARLQRQDPNLTTAIRFYAGIGSEYSVQAVRCRLRTLRSSGEDGTIGHANSATMHATCGVET